MLTEQNRDVVYVCAYIISDYTHPWTSERMLQRVYNHSSMFSSFLRRNMEKWYEKGTRKLVFVFFLIMCISVYLCLGVCSWMQVSAEARGVRFPGARVIGSCELSVVTAGNQIWVLWKSSYILLESKPPPSQAPEIMWVVLLCFVLFCRRQVSHVDQAAL